MRVLIIYFTQIFPVVTITSSIYFAGIIATILYCSTNPTCFIEPTVYSIKYITDKNWIAIYAG